MEAYGDKLPHLTILVFTPDLTEEDIDEKIDEMLNGIAKTGRFLAWVIDFVPDCAQKVREKLYVKSRKFYSEQ